MKVIVDVGADGFPQGNIGYNTKESAKVYLFEPYPPSYEKLVARYGKNSNFHIYQLALANEVGTVNFYVTKKRNCSSLLKPNVEEEHVAKRADLHEYEEIEVKVEKMINVLGNLPRIDYLKLDTQGSEYEVLLGAENLLERVKHIKCEVEFFKMYEGQKLAEDIVELLASKGFEHTSTKMSTNHADYTFINKNLE